MGVGYSVDLVVCVALGVDMFDCVYPSRTARFGTALVREGTLQLTKNQFAKDTRPIDKDCYCSTCKNYTRAYLHIVAAKESTGAQLITIHNIAYQMRLMRDIRQSIIDQTFPQFVQQFMIQHYPTKKYPTWVVDALKDANITLL